MYKSSLVFAGFLKLVASKVLWDGRFNDVALVTDLELPDAPYYYIDHGWRSIDSYVELASNFKNPADQKSARGVKFTIDMFSFYANTSITSREERRTDLVPQNHVPIAIGGEVGKVFYHFSLAREIQWAPAIERTFQMAFFESHFTEMTYGYKEGADTSAVSLLRWDVEGTTLWNTTFQAREWHNIAYEVDYDEGTVGFWHSTGAEDLVLRVNPVLVNKGVIPTRRNWHLGLRELTRNGFDEYNTTNLYYSGIYIENGTMTTTVSGPGEIIKPDPAATSTEYVTSTNTPTPTPTTSIPKSAPPLAHATPTPTPIS
ncbi:hypothetical protein HYFRA_00004878 [Hymenoscyphus fraxineus]|uniref:Glycoside hydrolase 131 catalytic N-terminal domain-containing protein n=1 Tax=Hymenoscyphus fraxineus TaxID=746836 RepID=A0A9N9PN08_9HELO|nr:hypothetical protein HYFRA_00004878 [Hymenoscyphus fraxineus]